jgi:putative Mg2+ transporter-C (MgtC) family protein
MEPLIADREIFLRLIVITIISSFIGIEREYFRKPAGLRTNVMVGLGSTLMTIASIKAVELFPQVTTVDPTRIAAQIVTGIGFIGAGAILRPVGTNGNQNVVGLTTAATLWVVSGMGIAVGMGFYFEAILTALLVFFTFFALGKIVARVREFTISHPSKAVIEDEDTLRASEMSGTDSTEK